jgi:DNA-directed RNA polymerase specialized sigma24 family protein
MALTRDGLDSLLAILGPDREAAGERYEAIRRRLLIFFATRHCVPGEDFADETLDRTARRVSEGVTIQPSIESFVLGIARNVVREQWKKPGASAAMVGDVDWSRVAARDQSGPGDENPDLLCLEDCLRELAPQSRKWIERFYSEEGSAKIRLRQRLAEELGIDANALRVRMHRIRAKLETCVRDCRRNRDGNDSVKGAISERER